MTSPTSNGATPEPTVERSGDQAGASPEATPATLTDRVTTPIGVGAVVATPPAQAGAMPAIVVTAPAGRTSPVPPDDRGGRPAGDVRATGGPSLRAVVQEYGERLAPVVPGLMIVLGLVAMFLAGLPLRSEQGAPSYPTLFAVFPVIAPIMLMFGFYLQARQILAGAFGKIDRTLNDLNAFRSDQLTEKLELLEAGMSLCKYATSKCKPIMLLALALLAYGAVFAVLSTTQFTVRTSPTGPQFDVAAGASLDQAGAPPNLLMEVLYHTAPPIALITGLILIVWYAYQSARLKEFARYIVDERAVVIGKKRILDRYAARYVELSSLTEQVSEMIKVNEQLATSDAGKNSALLLLGVILSALISIVGILGAADLLVFGGVPLNGNVVSAILGVVVAAIITTQNTFRLAERSRFQRQVAGDARKLFTELVFAVDDNDKFQAALKEYQRLSDRSVRDFPTARELEAPAEAARGQGGSAPRTG